MDNKKIYVAGSGTTFTPSRNATWPEEFNELLVSTGMSRNKLTEHLLSQALQNRKNQTRSNESSIFNTSKYSKEELELLSTTYFQNAIEKFIRVLLSEQNNIVETAQKQAIGHVVNEDIDSISKLSATTRPINVAEPEISATQTPPAGKPRKAADVNKAMQLLNSMKQ